MTRFHTTCFLRHAVCQLNVTAAPCEVCVVLLDTVVKSKQLDTAVFSVKPRAVEDLLCATSYTPFASRTTISNRGLHGVCRFVLRHRLSVELDPEKLRCEHTPSSVLHACWISALKSCVSLA